ncbi:MULTISPECIES: SPW repeat protein [unclassified Bradyrhizobium]|uniref:SPW repeat protein n=1 Tax=unclassified Bradyrhizobium TaxID=2631580 RepID=UPI001FF7B36E|nr:MULTISPECIES: SPW repeat protein [unclassified Bradyrhizobium]MCK1604944.1 SPW repeat protein [Bradyrhizobium sp. 166]UPK19187.1 SPW repeat protein [Bradyrhizobium sp. 131]
MYSTWRRELIPDVLNLLLGIGLFISPWLLGFSNERTPSWNAWASGLVIAALALAALTAFAEWEEWIALAVGVWVALSPWFVQFSNSATAKPVHVVAGTLVALIAAVRIWYAHGGHTQATA